MCAAVRTVPPTTTAGSVQPIGPATSNWATTSTIVAATAAGVAGCGVGDPRPVAGLSGARSTSAALMPEPPTSTPMRVRQRHEQTVGAYVPFTAAPGTVGRMSHPLEDYALLGDCRTAALVARNGSVDWWCVPRFDAGACFAALLGNSDHGRFLIAPVGPGEIERHYRPQSLVLETEHATAAGTARVIDCLATGTPRPCWSASSKGSRAGRT